MTLEEKAKEFVSKRASGTSQEMDYYANYLVEFANEDAKEHPLVTDKRCLNLYYWPDVIPDCFKDMEEV